MGAEAAAAGCGQHLGRELSALEAAAAEGRIVESGARVVTGAQPSRWQTKEGIRLRLEGMSASEY